MKKKVFFLALCSLIAALISFLKLNKHKKRRRNRQSKGKNKSQSKASMMKVEQSFIKKVSNCQQNADKITGSVYKELQVRELYNLELAQTKGNALFVRNAQKNKQIEGLKYKIILNLEKGFQYFGVVSIHFIYHSFREVNDISISFSGRILFFGVNGRRLDPNQFQYCNHQILIGKKYLLETENVVEIIFKNRYSFLGDGLSTYFPLGENNKYSMKGQVIYSSNGNSGFHIAKIIPSFNILNPCQVNLQILHPNGFISESNTYKTISKLVTKKEYPAYPFLFENNSNCVEEKSLRTSSGSETSIRSKESPIKAKSQFALMRLVSIHDLFIFCSAVVEVRVGVSKSLKRHISMIELQGPKKDSTTQEDRINKDMLLRFYAKQKLTKKAQSFLQLLESQIYEIYQKVERCKQKYKFSRYNGKIDIFFIADLNFEGCFNSGAILLSQNCLQRGIIDRRVCYLICRAILGMGKLSKRCNFLTKMSSIFELNEFTVKMFPEYSDFIHVKNVQYSLIRKQCIKFLEEEILNYKNHKFQANQIYCWLPSYYQKQCRYLVRQSSDFESQISKNVKNIIENLQEMQPFQFWTYFIARYHLYEFNVSQVLIKLGLIKKGVPLNETERKFARENFIKSKYYLSFFSLSQIKRNFKRLIELNVAGLQRVLPSLKLKQSQLSYVPHKLEPYVYGQSNFLDCLKLYDQFQKFNEQTNFHHASSLHSQIMRIQSFFQARFYQKNGSCAQKQKKGLAKKLLNNINCGIQGWKLLYQLNILPEDQAMRNFIQGIQGLRGMVPKEGFTQKQSSFFISSKGNPVSESSTSILGDQFLNFFQPDKKMSKDKQIVKSLDNYSKRKETNTFKFFKSER